MNELTRFEKRIITGGMLLMGLLIVGAIAAAMTESKHGGTNYNNGYNAGYNAGYNDSYYKAFYDATFKKQ